MSNGKVDEMKVNIADYDPYFIGLTKDGAILHEIRFSSDDRSRIDSLIKSINNLSDRLVILKDGHE